jgi:hypothetical protein
MTQPTSRRLLCAGLAALALGFTVPALPQATSAALPNAYRVEIVIFRNDNMKTDENLDAPAEGRGFADGNSNGQPPKVIKILGPESAQLGGIANKLRSSGYRVLGHAIWLQTSTNWPAHLGVDLADVGIATPELSGQIFIERGTLLHMGVNITLATGAGPTYRLSELRRVKFNENQYFDHPAMGVIAIVSQAGKADPTP